MARKTLLPPVGLDGNPQATTATGSLTTDGIGMVSQTALLAGSGKPDGGAVSAPVIEVATISIGQTIPIGQTGCGDHQQAGLQFVPNLNVGGVSATVDEAGGSATIGEAIDAVVNGIHADLSGSLKNLNVKSTADAREKSRAAIEATTGFSNIIEGGSHLVLQMSVAGTAVFYISCGATDHQREETLVDVLKPMKLASSKSKVPTSNATIATFRIDIATKDSKVASDNRKRLERLSLAVQAAARQTIAKAKAGDISFDDGGALFEYANTFIKDGGGVNAVAEAERKFRNEADDLLNGTGGIKEIDLDAVNYATLRSTIAKSVLAAKAGPDGDYDIGFSFVLDGERVGFQAAQIDQKTKQKLLDTVVTPIPAVEFLGQLVVLGHAIAEVKTNTCLNPADNPKDPGSPKVIGRRTIILRPDGQFVVAAHDVGAVDCGVVLLAKATEPMPTGPVHGDFLIDHVGYAHLYKNVEDPARRAAFTAVKFCPAPSEASGATPLTLKLYTEVARAKDHKDGKAFCSAVLTPADVAATADIKVVDSALVKPTATATVKATNFKDVADRIDTLSGKKAGDRVTISVSDDGLDLTTDAGKVTIAAKIEFDQGNALIVSAHRSDLTGVMEAIALQRLTGPVLIKIDKTGIVQFDFTTSVGEFSLLVPAMNNKGRNPRHYIPFTPILWTSAAAQAAA